jgi:hypothetical protein
MRVPRPLIFLDIDGVLNGHNFDDHPGVFSNPIDRECVEALNRLIVAVDPEIVLSSAWRYMIHGGAMTLVGFEYLLRTHGAMAQGRLVGYTARDEEIQMRGEQIASWLRQHGPRPYVVLDDGGCVPGTDQWSDLGLSVHPVVWTRGNVGLTDFEVAKAIEVLKRQEVAS